MIAAPIPESEEKRLTALRSYSILDTFPEKEYDDITRLASQICQTPVSQITLVDSKRQWYKSNFGVDIKEVPREVGFCSHTINNPDGVLVVPDMRIDQRFVDNPFVKNIPHAVFYTGVSLVSPEGYPIGSICVIDLEPRELSTSQVEALKSLSNQIINLFELRKSKHLLDQHTMALEERNKELRQFASIVAHDIKSPLTNIQMHTKTILEFYPDELGNEVRSMIGHIGSSSEKLVKLVEGILTLSKSANLLTRNKETIGLREFFEEIIELVDNHKSTKIIYPTDGNIFSNRIALQQIFINLINNAIKHSDQDRVKIEIAHSSDNEYHHFTLSDNGPGIKENDRKRIFELFETCSEHCTEPGHGIGLSIVKRLVEGLSGKIHVETAPGRGAAFHFKIQSDSF